MRTMASSSHVPGREWQLAIAAGFVALTVSGAAVDRRNAFIDRGVTSPSTVERAVAPPTSGELAQEMMTHD